MKIAVVQLVNTRDIDFNFLQIKKIIENIHKDSQIIMFPECALTGYSVSEDMISIRLDDTRLMALQALAIRYQVTIFIGATYKDEDLFNGYFKINSDIEVYNKTHLGSNETKVYKAGTALKSFLVDQIKIGIAICIESHIPDISQHYRLDGCDLILMPFASPHRAGSRKALWDKYLPTRAYDNNLYILACNLSGEVNGLKYSGGMMALDPRGNIINEKYEDGNQIMYVTIDHKLIDKLHNSSYKCNYVEKRKVELYRKD